jgi:hypothetical protein
VTSLLDTDHITILQRETGPDFVPGPCHSPKPFSLVASPTEYVHETT